MCAEARRGAFGPSNGGGKGSNCGSAVQVPGLPRAVIRGPFQVHPARSLLPFVGPAADDERCHAARPRSSPALRHGWMPVCVKFSQPVARRVQLLWGGPAWTRYTTFGWIGCPTPSAFRSPLHSCASRKERRKGQTCMYCILERIAPERKP